MSDYFAQVVAAATQAANDKEMDQHQNDSIDCPATNPEKVQKNDENLWKYQAETNAFNARKASSKGNCTTQIGYRGETACPA
eukprot:14527391-Ditylum_brightwellii.AAC.1